MGLQYTVYCVPVLWAKMILYTVFPSYGPTVYCILCSRLMGLQYTVYCVPVLWAYSILYTVFPSYGPTVYCILCSRLMGQK